MKNQLSPRFGHDKFNDPDLHDLVDVFEDSWVGFMLEPARILLQHPSGDVAAITLLVSYFEALAIFVRGEDSDGKSQRFFVEGFCRVFPTKMDSESHQAAAKAIYRNIRCGVAHTGMLTRKVHFTREGHSPFFLTYPKRPDGSLDTDAEVASIIVNPALMYESIRHHFDDYIQALRAGNDPAITEPFTRSMKRLWGIGEPDNIVGMTEDEFRGLT